MFDAISNSPLRLDRALRLEDLLLSGSAIPIPLDQLAAPIAENDRDALTETSPDDHEQIDHAAANAVSSQPVNEAIQHQESQQHDGLTASLQASADAIHQSLAHDTPTAALSDVSAQSAPGYVAEADASQTIGSQTITTAEHFTAETTTVRANTMAPSGSGSSVAQIGVVASADSMTASALHDTTDVTAGLSGTIVNITGSLTVPSLHGVGVDSLVGLVQPISVPLALVSSTVDASISIDHPILSAPIGLEDVHHVDSAATHLIHPVASLVGSGLI